MNVDALFDKLAVDLEATGVERIDDGSARTLTFNGTPFARLTGGETMVFYLPPGSRSHSEALALHTSTPVGRPGWVEVPAQDVSQWPTLAEQALAGLRKHH